MQRRITTRKEVRKLIPDLPESLVREATQMNFYVEEKQTEVPRPNPLTRITSALVRGLDFAFQYDMFGGKMSKIKTLLAMLAVLGSGLTNAETYAVKKGDTLSAIAKRHNVSVKEIAEANKIQDINMIYIGQKLELPEEFDFSKDSDETLLAKMLFGEARGCSPLEMSAIAYTSINRANDRKKCNGETLRDAILAPQQYSCFNRTNINRKKLINPEKYEPKAWENCREVAKKVLEGKFENPGATHYHTPTVNPKWASSSKMQRVNINARNLKHIFYRER